MLFTILAIMIRLGALKRPGLVLGSFVALYGLARITGEMFREPDPQLGFLWGGLTMGMLLSVPMVVAGAIIIVQTLRREAPQAGQGQHGTDPGRELVHLHATRDRIRAAPVGDQEADQLVGSDAGLALHGTVPAASAARLLHRPRSARTGGRFHDGARSQPDVRRIARAMGGFGLEGDRLADHASADRTRPRPRHHDGGCAAGAAGAAAALPGAHVHMVEINPVLREKQRTTLSGVRNIAWHNHIDEVPDGPCIIFANEYFDALPVHQMVKRETGWHERVVDLDENGTLIFGVEFDPTPRFEVLLPPLVRAAPVGAVFEWRPDTEIMKLARRVRDQDGAALIIDYGHMRSDAGDTFQAIARHSYTDPAEGAGPGRPDGARRFSRHGARRRGSRRPRPWPGDAGRVSEATRHRDPRGRADVEGQPRDVRGHCPGAEAADRRRPRRHGVDVQGAGHLAPQFDGAGRAQRGQAEREGRAEHETGFAAALGHPGPAPRLLHARGRRLRRHLCGPQWRSRFQRRSRQGGREPPPHGGADGRFARRIFSACIRSIRPTR